MNEPTPLMIVAEANALITLSIGKAIRDKLPLRMQDNLFIDISAKLDRLLEKRNASEYVEREARLFLDGLNHAARTGRPP